MQQEKSIADTVSKMESDEVRNLIPVRVNRANNENTHKDSLKSKSALIASGTMKIIRNPGFHEPFVSMVSCTYMSSCHLKLLKLKRRLDTLIHHLKRKQSGILEPDTINMDEDSTDRIDTFLLMGQVKPLEYDEMRVK